LSERFYPEGRVGPFKVSFDAMEWEQLRPDVRQKIYRGAGHQIRLVDFETSEGAEHWCEIGHIGYVLKGALSISFNGQVVSFKAGDGVVIPSGAATKHRAVSISAGTQLLMVEET